MNAVATNHPDAALLNAERRARALLARLDALNDDDVAQRNALVGELAALDKRIARRRARTIEGAAVKLRRLLDPDVGMANGPRPEEYRSLRHVLAIVEQAGKASAA